MSMSWNPESQYCVKVRAYAKAECKTYWQAYRLPAEINRLTDLTRTTIAREMRRGIFEVATIPSVRDVTRRVNELAQTKRYPTGITELVCIGERRLAGIVGSYYIPQPMEYELGWERLELEKLLPVKVNQEQLTF